MKKITTLLLVLILCTVALPTTALADDLPAEIDLSAGNIAITVTDEDTMNVTYYTTTGSGGTASKQNISISSTVVTIIGNGGNRVIKVVDDTSNSTPVNIQLKDMTGEQLALEGHAHVDLTLVGDSAFKIQAANLAAVQVPAGCALTINAASTSSLTAESQDGAGIGGGSSGSGESTAGNITINGGTVSATSANGAGIGGGYGSGSVGGSGTISISGGFVTATGGADAQDIGGAKGSANGLTISGGSVWPTRLDTNNVDAITDCIAVSSASGPFPVAVPLTLDGKTLTGGKVVKVPLQGDNSYTATTITVDGGGKPIEHDDTFPFAALLWLKKDAYIDITVGDATASAYATARTWPDDTNYLNILYPYPLQVQLADDADLTITVIQDNITGTTVASGLMKITCANPSLDLTVPIPGTQLSLSLADGANTAGTVTVNGDSYTHDLVAILLSGLDAKQLALENKAGVRLTLQGGNDIAPTNSSYAAIQVPEGCALTITEASTGSLTATAVSGAGIGGGANSNGGTIIIKGGSITANSKNGAGIGGGGDGTIAISGGFVTATGAGGAQDIGNGNNAAGGGVTITGGSVWATRLNASNIADITKYIAFAPDDIRYPVAVPTSFGEGKTVNVQQTESRSYTAQTVSSTIGQGNAPDGTAFPFGALLWLQAGHYDDIAVGSLAELEAQVDHAWPSGERGNTVYALIKLSTIELTADNTSLTVGDTAQVTATLLPNNADNKTINWQLEPTDLATFDETTNKLTATGAGTVTLTAAAVDGSGVKGSIAFTITKPDDTPDNPLKPYYSNIGSWINDEKGKKALDAFGDPIIANWGWEEQSQTWYHFDSNGYMRSNKWVKTKDRYGKYHWYYLLQSGIMATDWEKIDGEWYYFDIPDGNMRTGWIQIKGKWYWLRKNGTMATGYEQANKRWSRFSSSGVWQGYAKNTGWKKYSKGWSFRANGSWAKSKWLQINGKWYAFDNAGYMRTGWVKSGGKWYWLKSSGVMVTSDTTIGGKVNRFDSSGKWLGAK